MKLPIGRIALRIYIVGLLQVVLATAAAAGIVISAQRSYRETAEDAVPAFLAEQVLLELESGGTFEARVKALGAGLHAGIRVVGTDGASIFSTGTELASCWPSPPRKNAVVVASDRVCVARHVALRDGKLVSIDVVRRRAVLSLETFALINVVIFGVGSILLGRSLAGPLRQMSEAARAFGRGDTKVRIRSKRTDELGEVAGAFDEMADQLVDFRRMERELLANVSHELRTPLTRIRLALEFASDSNADVAFQSRKDIAEDLDELERFITDILAAARLEIEDPAQAKGISPLRREVIEVREIIGRAEARFRAAHPERTLRVVDDASDAAFDVDPVQIRRAVDNLLDNAHKYSDAAKAIELRVAATKTAVKIRVIDHGVGISADDQKRLFRPFFRVDRSRSRATGGLGLGLLLVRRIVEAHAGTIALDSDPGRGTEAIVELPRAVDEPTHSDTK